MADCKRGESLSSTEKRKLTQLKRDRSKVYLLEANEEWQKEKSLWIGVNLGSQEKTVFAKPCSNVPRLDLEGNMVLSRLVKQISRNVESVPKMNVYFAQHLLEIHQRSCTECYCKDGNEKKGRISDSPEVRELLDRMQAKISSECTFVEEILPDGNDGEEETESLLSSKASQSLDLTVINVLNLDDEDEIYNDKSKTPSRKRKSSTPICFTTQKRLFCRNSDTVENISPVSTCGTPKSIKTNATAGSPNKSTLLDLSINEMEIEGETTVESPLCLSSTELLQDLVKYHTGSICQVDNCGKALDFKSYFQGAKYCISWKCKCRKKYHHGKWESTPKNINLKLAASLLFSGQSFSKFEHFSKLLNFKTIGSTTVLDKQVNDCYSSIMQYWDSEQLALLVNRHDPLVISCDARNDSPGYCAKNCTYTAIDLKTQKIIAVEFADARLTDNKSPNMEAFCFQRLVEKLQQHCTIAEIATDGHREIKSILRKKYPHIKHSLDIWHSAKLLRKRLAVASKQRGCEELAKFIDDVVNHFWWCAKNCDRSTNYMIILWLQLLHHVQNVHEWPLGQCAHDQLNEEERSKPWLKNGSVPFLELKKIVCDRAFLKDFPLFINNRHTGKLESYHSLLLKYAPKRLNYPWKGYIARNVLAILDYNSHLNRPVALDKNGKQRVKSKYSKTTSKWTVVPVKIPKRHEQSKDLMHLTLSGKDS